MRSRTEPIGIDALFIADLHLQVSEPLTLDLARQFLTRVAPSSPRLFILGDLVEYWIGDDADDGALDIFFDPLAALPGQGTKICLMHGNRDFLLGARFARRINAQLIRGDHYLLDTSSSRLLLMHGDSLCTADTEFQLMRKKLHSDHWQQAFLAKSLKQRQDYAVSLRDDSFRLNADKDQHLMDVTEDAVTAIMREHNVTTLVHGHTHQPARHDILVDGKTATRWVLGDWHPEQAVYGVLQDGIFRLEVFAY